eukprot:1033404-Prymnesium_polylepis.1
MAEGLGEKSGDASFGLEAANSANQARPFLVETDAANTGGLNGMLSQLDDSGNERVISHYSRKHPEDMPDLIEQEQSLAESLNLTAERSLVLAEA